MAEPIRVLIIEDEEIISQALQKKLVKDNFVLLVAKDGETGLKIAFEQKPQVILLDLLMPKVSGFEFLRKAKENEATKNIPILVLTNLDDSSYLKKAIDLGAAEYLVKTRTNLEELKNKLRQHAAK